MHPAFLTFGYLVLGLCLAAMGLRFVLGPTLHDRLVAIEASTVVLLAGMALWSIDKSKYWLFDVVLVIALVGFLSTVALARFVEQGDIRND